MTSEPRRTNEEETFLLAWVGEDATSESKDLATDATELLLSRRLLFEHFWSSAGFAWFSHRCRMRLNVEVNDVEDVEHVDACIASTLPGHHLGTPNTPSRWHCAVLPDRGLKAVAAAQGKQLFSVHSLYSSSCSGVMFGGMALYDDISNFSLCGTATCIELLLQDSSPTGSLLRIRFLGSCSALD